MLWKFLVNYELSQSPQVVEGNVTLPKSTLPWEKVGANNQFKESSFSSLTT